MRLTCRIRQFCFKRMEGRTTLKRRKHRGLIAVLVLAAVLAGLITSYCVYAERYRDTFLEGTYINGIDAGGLDAGEVEKIIRDRVEDYTLTLTFRGGETETLSAEDLGLSYASDKGVVKLLSTQNPYEWILARLGNSSSYTVGESYTYDQEKLEESLKALPEFDPENIIKARDACMKMSENHELVIIPEADGNEIRTDVVIDAMKEAVESGKTSLDVSSLENAYITSKVKADNEDLNTQVNDLNTYLNVTVTYDMYDGSQVVVDRSKIAEWLSVKEDDPDYYYFNTDVVHTKCREFLKEMASKYDHTYDTLSFHSTNRGDMTMPTETRGYLVDEEGETEELYNTILGRQSDEREPLYNLNVEPYGSLKTYVEVDIQNQHVYYSRGGDCIFDSACVTGLQSDSSRRTPTGVFSVIEMDTARTLRGETNPATGQPSYESFVNYWMRFYEGCGLHDASWRSNFGGDIYLSSGSHGCVNMPYSAAQTLYGLVEYGTPVIVI